MRVFSRALPKLKGVAITGALLVAIVGAIGQSPTAQAERLPSEFLGQWCVSDKHAETTWYRRLDQYEQCKDEDDALTITQTDLTGIDSACFVGSIEQAGQSAVIQGYCADAAGATTFNRLVLTIECSASTARYYAKSHERVAMILVLVPGLTEQQMIDRVTEWIPLVRDQMTKERLLLLLRNSLRAGDLPLAKTIGIVAVAAFAIRAGSLPPAARIMVTGRLTRSPASFGNLSY